MTPTREQLATLLEEVKRCIYHPQPAEEDNARKKLDHVIACLAAPPQATPEPPCTCHAQPGETHARNCPAEPQAMPPIEVGDVARLDGFGLVMVNRPAEADVLSRGSDGLAAIYKPVWTRETRR